jgi:PAS domain S-box
MNNQAKTKAQLLKEISVLNKKIKKIEKTETAYKLLEEALRESEEKYRTILENIEDGYYEVDLKGNFTFFNDSLCHIHGYPREELMGMNYHQYIDDENLKKVFPIFNNVYKTGVPAKGFAWPIIRKDGSKRYIEASVSLRKNSSGQPIGFRGITRDITERKRVEEELHRQREWYRVTLASIGDAVIATDAEGRVTFMNDRCGSIDRLAPP